MHSHVLRTTQLSLKVLEMSPLEKQSKVKRICETTKFSLDWNSEKVMNSEIAEDEKDGNKWREWS